MPRTTQRSAPIDKNRIKEIEKRTERIEEERQLKKQAREKIQHFKALKVKRQQQEKLVAPILLIITIIITLLISLFFKL